MRTAIFAILLSVSTPAYGNLYDWPVTRVIDGDTVEVAVDFLPVELKPFLHVRILGVDTPEKGPRAKCHLEESLSLRAKLFTTQEISHAKKVQILVKSWDKYGGRILGDVIIDGKPLSKELIKNGYAKPYNGHGAKFAWCGWKWKFPWEIKTGRQNLI